MKYLITGGAGFIGSHLVDALMAKNEEVVILDDLSTGRIENIEHCLGSNQVRFVEGSTTDEGLVDGCMGEADVCLHLASAVGVKLIVSQPLDTLLRNVRGADTVLAAAARHERRLLFTSTSEIYGKSGEQVLSEDCDRLLGSPLKSRWSYGIAKAFGEALVSSYHRQRGSEMIVVRLFNTVGPRQAGAYGMVLPRFVQQALDGDDLTVYGNGTQSRCFMHVADAVQAILHLVESDLALGKAYNVGSDVEVAIVELARRVLEYVGSESKIELVPYEEAYDEGFEELGRRRPDASAIERLIGWKPTRSLDDAIEDVITHERSTMALRRNGTLAR